MQALPLSPVPAGADRRDVHAGLRSGVAGQRQAVPAAVERLGTTLVRA